MISIKCTNCAAELSVDAGGALYCPYCGSKSHLSDLEMEGYKSFRLNTLKYIASLSDNWAESSEDSSVWDYTETVIFRVADGPKVVVKYTFTYEEDGVKTYVTKNSVVHVFEKDMKASAAAFIKNVGSIMYPEADVKGLDKCFPNVKTRLELDDGRVLVALVKPENVYPLFAFGNLRYKHVAWIVSRMENFACLLEYNEKCHGGFTTNSIFINPRTHEAYLLGGWWNLRNNYSGLANDMCAIRKIAKDLLGENIHETPEVFKNFIKSTPRQDAFEDFAYWDMVIEGMGGHNFTPFDAN